MAADIGGVLVGLARRQGISEMLHRTAARVPGKLAIVNGQTRLTFAELEAEVSRTAAALAAEGGAISECYGQFESQPIEP